MSKDFNQFINQEENQSTYQKQQQELDPNVFVSQEMKQSIYQYNAKQQIIQLFSQSTFNLILYPLTTIYTSLQLSVLPHQNKYGDSNNPQSSTALTKTTKDIQPHDKRKFELLLKSGVVGSNKPYRAPVYTSYKECITGLFNQGWQGFYKGNLLGLIHLFVNSSTKFQCMAQLDYNMNVTWHKGNIFSRQALIFASLTVVDIITNPILLFQSRFILQNRLPNFYLYKSIGAAVKKHIINKKEYYQGSTIHIYKNLSIFLIQIPMNLSSSLSQFQALYFFTTFNVINYSFLTILRRIHCQSQLPGMIPPRYRNTWHAMRLIIQEEGFKGLFRGFPLYLLQNSLLQYLVFGGSY